MVTWICNWMGLLIISWTLWCQWRFMLIYLVRLCLQCSPPMLLSSPSWSGSTSYQGAASTQNFLHTAAVSNNPQHYRGPWCVTYSQHHMSAKKSHTISIWVGCYNELLFWYDSNVTLNSLILIWLDATLFFIYLYNLAVMCPGQTAAVKVMALWSGAAAVGGTSTCCNLRRGRMAGTCCCWSTWDAPSDRVL